MDAGERRFWETAVSETRLEVDLFGMGNLRILAVRRTAGCQDATAHATGAQRGLWHSSSVGHRGNNE